MSAPMSIEMRESRALELNGDVEEQTTLREAMKMHLAPLDVVYRLVKSSPSGLTSDERARRREGRPNVLTPAKRISPLMSFFKSQTDLFAILFWCATIGCFALFWICEAAGEPGEENLYTGCCVLFVNLFQGVMSYVQTKSSQAVLDSFNKMIPQKTTVVEDGKQRDINTEDVVIGDVVLLKTGQKVPADLRITEAQGLKLDLSAFTGEAEPQQRSTTNSENEVLNATNLAFMTCPVMSGEGKGVVIATGDDSQIGKHKTQLDSVPVLKTPIQIEIKKFVAFVSSYAVGFGVLFFIVDLVVGVALRDAFLYAISIIIATVPEGLPISITVILKQAASNLAKKNVLVKSLTDVETLGSVSVICTDKTGTITRNQMTVCHTFDNTKVNDVDWIFTQQKCQSSIDLLSLQVLALNSKSEFDENDNKANILDRKIFGDASESGILRFAELSLNQHDSSIMQIREQYPKKFEKIFNSVDKYQLSVHKYSDSQDLITVKGAPEIVYNMCKHIQTNDEKHEKKDSDFKVFDDAYRQVASFGERLLGFGYCYFPQQEQYTKFDNFDDLTFLGFVSLHDPPKDGVTHAVEQCKTASIKVTMVTGDHYLTATAIAKQIGIFNDDIEIYINPQESYLFDDQFIRKEITIDKKCCKRKDMLLLNNKFEYSPIHKNSESGAVMTGDFLSELSDEQVKVFLQAYKNIVFARTTPAQKLRIVTQYQALGNIVAVSGDGLNDAAALRKANVGVAMASGSQVARDAGNIVLVDDSFATIVYGINEGRRIFENLKKSMCYAMSTAVPELIPFLMYVCCGFPMVLGNVVIILIDMATEIWPTFAMAFEPAESDLMERPPRAPNSRLFDFNTFFHSYIRVGCVQLFSLLFCFILSMSECYEEYTGQKLPISAFFSIIHHDFLTVTLPNLLEKSNIEKSRIETIAKHIFLIGQTASFMSIIETQISHAIMGRVRINSLWKQGFFSNRWIVCTYPIQLFFGLLCIYVPQLHHFMSTESLPYKYWLYNLTFTLWLPIYDEFRRLLIRKLNKDSKIRKFLYW